MWRGGAGGKREKLWGGVRVSEDWEEGSPGRGGERNRRERSDCKGGFFVG